MCRHVSTDRLDATDNLVTGHDGDHGIREFSVDEVEVGAADPARENLHKNVR
jgi:hypothetical protein